SDRKTMGDAELGVDGVADLVGQPGGALDVAFTPCADRIDLRRIDIVGLNRLSQEVEKAVERPAVGVVLERALELEVPCPTELGGERLRLPAPGPDEPRISELGIVEQVRVASVPQGCHVRSGERA